MATKRKFHDEDNGITGYIHQVTPIKRSAKNNPYFNGLIQTDTDVYERLVCFDTQKHSTLKQAELSKRPLTLKNVTKSPSREDGNKTDVLVSAKAFINTTARRLEFSFHDVPTTDESNRENRLIKIAEMVDIPERNTVSLVALVIKKKEQSVQEVYGRLLKVQQIHIADETGSIFLTLWADLVDTVQEGETYTIRSVSTRLRGTEKTLTSTKQSTIIINDDKIALTNQPEEMNPVKTIEGIIASLCIKKHHLCPACKQKIDISENSQYSRCHSCQMKHKLSSITPSLIANMTVQTDTASFKLTAFHTPLATLALKQALNLMDVDGLENYLLDQPKVKVDFNKTDNIVVSINI